MELRGKTALVTGGGVRLGRAIALTLAQAGCNVAIHYNRSESEAREVRDGALKYGILAETFQFNLLDFEHVDQLFREVNQKLGKVDILINNAGNYKRGKGLETSKQVLDDSFNLNLFAPFWLIKSFANQLPTDAIGKIISICDAAIFGTGYDHFAYRLTKKGLCEMTKMFALELAPRITVNAIAPGTMMPLAGFEDRDLKEKIARQIPLRRIGSPEIIAQNVLHILDQDFMTGSIIKVDGGEFAG